MASATSSGIQPADLGFFSVLAGAGSLSAAARELGITTPAVSKHLALMESRVGLSLVNRTTRRMSLTPEGELYLEHARRICAHDAVEVIDHMLPLQSLDGVHIFFPDPWHKTKHNKRRLIQSPLVAKLAQRLKVGGYLHCATDWQPYAEQILEVLSAEPRLKNRALATNPELNGYAPKPHYRPLTKFENRGLKLGHGVWDVVFERV